VAGWSQRVLLPFLYWSLREGCANAIELQIEAFRMCCDDRRFGFRETEECPQASVLGTQPLDLARGVIEPELEIAIGHVRTGRGLYVPPLSAP